MPISQTDVLKVAHLARINLAEEEVNLFAIQLESILEFIDKLKQVDISQVEPLSYVLSAQNILRPDKLKPSLPRDEALKNAPLSLKDHFQVPKVIE